MVKAYMKDKRISEEWQIRVDVLFKTFGIPLAHLESVCFDRDYDTHKDEADREDEVLIIRVTRDSVKERQAAMRRKQLGR